MIPLVVPSQVAVRRSDGLLGDKYHHNDAWLSSEALHCTVAILEIIWIFFADYDTVAICDPILVRGFASIGNYFSGHVSCRALRTYLAWYYWAYDLLSITDEVHSPDSSRSVLAHYLSLAAALRSRHHLARVVDMAINF